MEAVLTSLAMRVWLPVCCLQVKAEFGCFLTWLIAFSVFMLLFQVGLAMQCHQHTRTWNPSLRQPHPFPSHLPWFASCTVLKQA